MQKCRNGAPPLFYNFFLYNTSSGRHVNMCHRWFSAFTQLESMHIWIHYNITITPEDIFPCTRGTLCLYDGWNVMIGAAETITRVENKPLLNLKQAIIAWYKSYSFSEPVVSGILGSINASPSPGPYIYAARSSTLQVYFLDWGCISLSLTWGVNSHSRCVISSELWWNSFWRYMKNFTKMRRKFVTLDWGVVL